MTESGFFIPQFDIKRKGKNFLKVYGFGFFIGVFACFLFFCTAIAIVSYNLDDLDWIHNNNWWDKAILMRYRRLVCLIAFVIFFLICMSIFIVERCVKENDDIEELKKEIEELKKNNKKLKENMDELIFVDIEKSNKNKDNQE